MMKKIFCLLLMMGIVEVAFGQRYRAEIEVKLAKIKYPVDFLGKRYMKIGDKLDSFLIFKEGSPQCLFSHLEPTFDGSSLKGNIYFSANQVPTQLLFKRFYTESYSSNWFNDTFGSKQTREKINDYHVNYKLYFPHQYYPILGLLYLLPIIVPPLASSVKEIRLIGILLLLSFIITKILFNDEVISVWCFFAALVSIIVFWVLKNHTQSKSSFQVK